MWVKPAGADTGVPAAPDVRGQAVPHHQGTGGVKAGDGGKAGTEKSGTGLMEADLFRDEDVLEIRSNARVRQAAALDRGSAVGG